MNKKIAISLVVVAFILGALLGASGGAIWVLREETRYEVDAIASAIAETSFGIVPVVLALNQNDAQERLDRFEMAARAELNAGVVSLHASLPMLGAKKRDEMVKVLRSISRNREKLAIGRFDEPPKEDIEEILAGYAY